MEIRLENNKEGRERRRFLRVPFEATVVVKNLSEGTILKDLDTKDISMKGIYCLTDSPFEPETPCAVELQLTGTSTELWFRIDGKVARKDKGGMAIIFDSMDLDAFIHLKNILYYNSGDPDRIDKEIVKYQLNSNLAPEALEKNK